MLYDGPIVWMASASVKTLVTCLFSRIRGLIAAIDHHCPDSSHMCDNFVRLTTTEMRQYYDAVEFDILEYAGGFKLPYVHRIENRATKDLFLSVYQMQKLDDGTYVENRVSLKPKSVNSINSTNINKCFSN